MRPPPDILRRIVRTKRHEVRQLRARADELRSRAADAPPVRDFVGAVRRDGEVALIAEVKRRSPGAGAIRPGLDPAKLAAGYARRGARAVSVLTDRHYFGGSLEDLEAVKTAVELPALRKDFVVDPLQVAEARAAGADAVLLIVRVLDDARLRELLHAAAEYGLATLVEVHDLDELRRAVQAGAGMVGINNRDLSTFDADLATTLALLEDVPPGTTVVSESGIRNPGDVDRLGSRGVDAVLVGEALLRADDPATRAGELAGRPKAVRR